MVLQGFNKILLSVFIRRSFCNPLIMLVLCGKQVFLPVSPDAGFTLFYFRFSLYFCIVKKRKNGQSNHSR